jgi:Tfp pilus assembly protein PilO
MEKQWNAWIERIQQPKMILVIVLVLGIFIDGSIYLYRVMPQFLPKHNLITQYNQLEKQRITLEKSSVPAKVSSEAIEKLVQQVPLSDNSAKFLISLREAELQSGVEIKSISDGSGSKVNAATELITSDGKANIPSANYNTQTTPTPSAEANAKNNKTVKTPASFMEQNMEVAVAGTYGQLMDFMNRLTSLPQFVNIKEWQLGDSSSNDALGQNAGIGGLTNHSLTPSATHTSEAQDKKTITLKLSLYSAAQYKEKFQDIPPVSITEEPEKRSDPTIPDERYNKLLESQSR